MMDAKRKAIEARIAAYLGPVAATLLALAAGFFCYAMPAAVIGRAFDPRIMGGHGSLAVIVALVVGLATYAVFSWLDRPAHAHAKALAAPEAASAPVLRRADAHPDAPPRRPIFAGSDLGTPLDLIAPLPAGVPEPAEADVAATPFPFAPIDIPADTNATAIRRPAALDSTAIATAPIADEAEPAPALSPAMPALPLAPSPAPAAPAQPLRTVMLRLEAALARKALVLAGAEPNVTVLRREIRPIAGTLSAAVEALQQRTAGRR